MNPSLTMPSSSPDSFSPRHRLLFAAGAGISTVSVVAIAVMLNYLALNYAPRFYWGASRDYQLSPLTLGALEALTNHVRVTVFFDRESPVYPSVRALLREYAAHSPRIEVDELDYIRYPAAAQEFRRRFPLTSTGDEPDFILFESGGRTKVVGAHDLRDYDTKALLRGEPEALPVAFRGELLFTSAINAVCEGRRRKVLFLQGHNENDIHSDSPDKGYSKLAAILSEDNIDVSNLRIEGDGDIPAECELLVIAGAVDPLTAGEKQVIDRYLRRGGRLFVLFRSVMFRGLGGTGLDQLLADWGVDVADSLVEDKENTSDGVMIVSHFGNHPVTRPLGGARILLFQPRAVRKGSAADILSAPARVEPLLLTGTNAVVLTTFSSTGPLHSPGDAHGEVPLAVAVERGALPGVAANLGTTRIVAVGSSSFLANQWIQFAGNRHFATSAVNWLLDRSYLLGGISPAPIHTYQVVMTPFEQRMVRLLLLAVLPGGALALGLIVWWRRH